MSFTDLTLARLCFSYALVLAYILRIDVIKPLHTIMPSTTSAPTLQNMEHVFLFFFLQLSLSCRDCFGDCVLAGDLRWAGTFGVNLDFVARSHCSVEFISIEDMQV
jgi:hypothetical protein